MPGAEILFFLACCALAWLWLDSLRARESAVRSARAACAVDGFMLLDDTVAISSVRPARDGNGRLQLQRTYEFEYSDTGDNRLKGTVILLGHRLVMLKVGPPGGPNVISLH